MRGVTFRLPRETSLRPLPHVTAPPEPAQR